ncbi:MAG: tyrosine-type recombinase/integrase [Acidimicrobiales bacterium]
MGRDGVRVLPVRSHRRPDRVEPGAVRAPPAGPSVKRSRFGPLRARRVLVHRRAARSRPRRPRRAARAERAAGERGVRHQHRGLGIGGHRTLRILGKGNKPATIPLVPSARTIDLAIGERCEGPILRRRDGHRLDRRTAHRWVRSIGKRAGLDLHPHMLRAAFIMAALDAGVPLRDVQIAARHADPRTTTIYDRRRQNFDRHAAYVVVAFVAGG